MPIIIPIHGAGGGGSVLTTRLFVCDSSIDILGPITSDVDGSIDITGPTQSPIESSIDLRKGTVDSIESSIDLSSSSVSNYSCIEGSCEIVAGDNFMIMVDVIAEALSANNLR